MPRHYNILLLIMCCNILIVRLMFKIINMLMWEQIWICSGFPFKTFLSLESNDENLHIVTSSSHYLWPFHFLGGILQATKIQCVEYLIEMTEVRVPQQPNFLFISISNFLATDFFKCCYQSGSFFIYLASITSVIH